MTKSRGIAALLALYCCAFLSAHVVLGEFPRAQNVTWKSTNFKTLLMWGPTPSTDYSYTVEYSIIGRDKEKNPHCIRTNETLCDLSSFLTDLKATYTADVLSEPPRSVSSDLIEFPYTSSGPFSPYKDTDIGRPDFKIKPGKDKTKITLYVQDQLTALFKGGQPRNIRDVFGNDLQYKVTYSRASSTGKKEYFSQSNEVELTNLDSKESYCFSVQAYIPSRRREKQLGEPSPIQCSHVDKHSIFDVYSVGSIAGGILLILAIVVTVIVVTVVCCKRHRKAQKRGKEALAHQGV